MKKVIITGNSGFVGKNLTKYFKSNYNILGVSRKKIEDKKKTINYSQLQKKTLDNCYALIHLAGKAHDLKNTSEDSVYYEVNTELTKKLFNKFLESNCNVFIYMSSVKAVADKVDGILDENVKPNPITIYGKSKLAAENYILSKEIPKNKRVYILRPCMIHGPNNKGNLNLLFSFVSKQIPYPFGAYDNKRSFVSVENLCFIINELIANDNIDSGIYNVADDGSISTNKLVEIIGDSISKPANIWKTPKSIINLIARTGDFISIPINSERLQKLTENYEVSNIKIKKAIQKKLPLSLEKGIEKTIISF